MHSDRQKEKISKRDLFNFFILRIHFIFVFTTFALIIVINNPYIDLKEFRYLIVIGSILTGFTYMIYNEIKRQIDLNYIMPYIWFMIALINLRMIYP